MKKAIIKLFFLAVFLLSANEVYATTYTAVAAGGNWNAATTWDVGSNFPIAGDTAVIDATLTGTVTVNVASACTTLNMTNNGGTLAFGAQTLTVSGLSTLYGTMTASTGGITGAGGVTLLGNTGGATQVLTINGASTLTSGGFTWGGKLTFSVAGNVVLSGNWINTGLVSFTSSSVLNKTTAETITCNGGLTMTSAEGLSATATIIIGGSGGVWSGAGNVTSNLTFNCTTATISGTVGKRGGTILYTAGTITTTGSKLVPANSTVTLNTPPANMHWTDVDMTVGADPAITFSSDCYFDGILLISNGTANFAGAYTITFDSIRMGNTQSSSRVITVGAGSTVVVNTYLYLCGTIVPSSGALASTDFKTNSSGTKAYLNYLGSPANCKVFVAAFTDIDASGSSQVIDNWYGGTLTRTTNITNRTSADIGGGSASDVFGII